MKNAHQQSLERGLLIIARIRNKARQCLITAAIGLAGVLSLMWAGPTAWSQNRPQPPNHTISLTTISVKQIDNVDDTRIEVIGNRSVGSARDGGRLIAVERRG